VAPFNHKQIISNATSCVTHAATLFLPVATLSRSHARKTYAPMNIIKFQTQIYFITYILLYYQKKAQWVAHTTK